MKRPAALAPLAASVALAMASLAPAQAQEVTAWDIPPPSATLTRAQVMAELQEWRMAGAHDPGNEAGTSDAVLQRRVAMNRLAQERHARAQELEQQRLAAEAAARAQPSSVIAQSPSAAGSSHAPAETPQGSAVATPIDSSAAAQPVEMPAKPADDPAPTPSRSDAITDWNRERMERDAATPLPGKPEEAPQGADASSVPMESEPADEVEAIEPVVVAPPASTVPPVTQESSSALPRDGAPSAGNAYGYQEPDDKYAPPETEAALDQAQSSPVR